MGSEPGVGWNTVCELGQYHKIWVFTREDNRSYIESKLSSSPISGLEFVYVDVDLPGSKCWKRSLGRVHIHHYLWQIKAYLLARKLHQEIGFDLSHHITYVRYSSPSFISFLPIPFIWGPVGGAESAPKAFWKDFSVQGKMYEIIRNTAHKLGEYDPFVRLTIQNSTLIRATTEDTAKRLRQMGAINVQVYSESGLSEEEIQQLAQRPIPDSHQIRFISMSRLLHWKGIHLGVKAFAQADLPNDTEYWILGDGPERERLQTLVEELDVSKRVKFWGRLSRSETLNKLSQSHVLIHPSLHDSGGWVCLEAMAAGCPVICLNLGGPTVQVTAETGFKIQASTPEEAVCGLAEAMTRLAQDGELRLSMGYAGQHLVAQSFNWGKKAESLAQLYEKTVQDHEYSNKALA
ncbi:glycosyltransferase family 4 protein [Halotia branconii]|uniref:Glycosyltransferase n=1 Tax=Halotia branconii CENA392 TaxID=1539056 RepID=A0AAJ6PBB8_9CYAN|nr:glycosyltransferase [Halotia branconii]WGV27601.1 glycosyltransferase [Halotia branconii CENA392]